MYFMLYSMDKDLRSLLIVLKICKSSILCMLMFFVISLSKSEPNINMVCTNFLLNILIRVVCATKTETIVDDLINVW